MLRRTFPVMWHRPDVHRRCNTRGSFMGVSGLAPGRQTGKNQTEIKEIKLSAEESRLWQRRRIEPGLRNKLEADPVKIFTQLRFHRPDIFAYHFQRLVSAAARNAPLGLTGERHGG